MSRERRQETHQRPSDPGRCCTSVLANMLQNTGFVHDFIPQQAQKHVHLANVYWWVCGQMGDVTGQSENPHAVSLYHVSAPMGECMTLCQQPSPSSLAVRESGL